MGYAIGSSSYGRQFVEEKVKGWSSDLTKVTQSQPEVVYSAFTKGLASLWIYVSCTILDIASFTYAPTLRSCLLCTYTCLDGCAPPNDFKCDLFALSSLWCSNLVVS